MYMGVIWENQPAKDWMQAYPIGNGRQGAMIFGGYQEERIQMNLDSLYYGGHVDRINPDARENLDKVRQLILEERFQEAEEILLYAFTGTPQSQRPYQTLGDLWITYQNAPDHVEKYRRELCLQKGMVTEYFETEKGSVSKEYFASYPDHVMVVHMKAEGEEELSLSVLLQRARFYEETGRVGDHTIYMQGQSGPNGVEFCTAVSAVVSGGTLAAIGEHLVVKNCKEIVLFISGETSFYGQNPKKTVQQRLADAEKMGFVQLFKCHTKDYKELFDRVEFVLDAGEESFGDEEMPFHERLLEHPNDPKVAESYYQFGRYLMIAGSRQGSLPLNLQGIWNEEMQPSWDSKYTININTEMNYWPAESCNLSECHEPLFGLIERMRISGKETARRMYGCRGFTAHHNTDVWADTAPQDIYLPASYWVLGGAWLCTHILTHFRYTNDRAFLARMYPCLEDAVRFFEDFMIEDRGELIVCPSVSPENTFITQSGKMSSICAGCTMDSEILHDLFTDYIEASSVLQIEGKLVDWAKMALTKLPKMKIGSYGQLQEWREDYGEKEPGHRHISHLYALYPSNQITWERTPKYMEAAKRTLEHRLENGGGYTGWSCAWMICMYARLEDGEGAYQCILKLLRESTSLNLMDTHPKRNGCVFQIDGNMGAAAGIVEMLVHAESGILKLLPALPKEWNSGHIYGVRILSDAEVSIDWQDGQVVHAVIKTGEKAQSFHVQCNGEWKEVSVQAHSELALV